jgi:protein involved in polysaccharide export with SLBB domain
MLQKMGHKLLAESDRRMSIAAKVPRRLWAAFLLVITAAFVQYASIGRTIATDLGANETTSRPVAILSPTGVITSRPSATVPEKGAPTAGRTDVALAPMGHAADSYAITSAERLMIKFQGHPELTGDYRVNADETISIPALGRIAVARMNAAELERALAEKVGKITGREAFITVEIAEYRPIFVSGFVSKPGVFPWKPGMTVLHAVTISGGIFRGPEGGMTLAADVEATRAQRGVADLKMLLATLARLYAEQKGSPKVEIPPRLIGLVGRTEAEELIAAQASTFTSRRTALETQLATLERGIVTTNQELEGLKLQYDRILEQLSLRRDYTKKLNDLLSKGLIRNDRIIDEQMKIADLEEKLTNNVVAVARVQSTLVTMQRDLENLKQERRAAVDAEVVRLEHEVVRLDIEIDAARAAYRKLTGHAASKQDSAKNAVMVYEIVRQEGGTSKTIDADQFTLLKPGDIVVLSAQQSR